MSCLRNKYGYMGFTELGAFAVFGTIVIGLIVALALIIPIIPSTPVSVLIDSHPAFAGLDCELMRNYISNSPNAHNHELLIYVDICL